jgi:8-oxo-dGTP diphosphatase
MKLIRLAGCIIKNVDGAVLLARRCDKAIPRWESPGGKIERGETAEAAVVRECLEELGITVRIDRPLTTTSFSQSDGEFSYDWFEASLIAGEPSIQEPHRHDRVAFIHPRDFSTLPDPISPNLQVLVQKGDIV